eukprot:15365040-Ditylum_brightwellii.AAC.2
MMIYGRRSGDDPGNKSSAIGVSATNVVATGVVATGAGTTGGGSTGLNSNSGTSVGPSHWGASQKVDLCGPGAVRNSGIGFVNKSRLRIGSA